MGELAAEKIRSPIVGGMFYPEDEEEACARLAAFRVARGSGGHAQAIIAPHGAWDISGRIAAEAFSAAAGRVPGVQDAVSRVLVLGTVHKAPESGIFISDSDFFQTPLGDIPVDRELSDEFISCSTCFEIDDIPHLREHSIEVLLPFVKYCFPDAAILPILMGKPRPYLVSELAKAMRIVLGPIMAETLIVVSCNLSMNTDPEKARSIAEECVRLLLEKNPETIGEAIAKEGANICGGALAASLLESGLVQDRQSRFVSNAFVHAQGEENKTVYYGAIAYE
jgi:AmmeMemoRadiSam system protein B